MFDADTPNNTIHNLIVTGEAAKKMGFKRLIGTSGNPTVTKLIKRIRKNVPRSFWVTAVGTAESIAVRYLATTQLECAVNDRDRHHLRHISIGLKATRSC